MRRLDETAREAEAAGVRAQKAARARAAGRGGAAATPECLRRMWLDRLREASRLRKAGVAPQEVRGGMLFHRKSGLCALRSEESSGNLRADWERIIKRCRRELRVAAKGSLAEAKA